MPAHKRKFIRDAGWLITLAMPFICVGCEQMFTAKDAQSIAPVSGKVLAGDKPVANAKVLFLPLNSSDGRYHFSYATTNELGRFTMRFESGVYGAHLGKNLVLISSCEKEEAEAADGTVSEKLIRAETVSPKFNTESALSIDVAPVGNASVVFQVDLLESDARIDSGEPPSN